MRIDILCDNEEGASFLGVTMKTMWGEDNQIGVGGAELALLTMCEGWHNAGHTVTLYNNPRDNESLFEQRHTDRFDPHASRDALIVFRSPCARAILADGLKVWWSTDQYTRGKFKEFHKYMDRTVCISQFHSEYFAHTYNIHNAHVVDLPVRTHDYENSGVQKIQNRFIFTSVPDRGLDNLWRMWHSIKKSIPDASLVITSDYRLWGVGEARNEKHRVRWLQHDDIHFMGAIPRKKLLEEELKAEIFLYPSSYEELFCISVAEAQVAGAYPITSAIGALPTTNMGTVLHVDASDPRNDVTFIANVMEIDRNKISELQEKAIKRFNVDNIIKQWDERIFK